jgi:hypothetical protein
MTASKGRLALILLCAFGLLAISAMLFYGSTMREHSTAIPESPQPSGRIGDESEADHAQAPDFASNPVPLPSQDASEAQSLAGSEIPQPFAIAGRVTNKTTGEPIGKAQVDCSP